MGEKMRTFPLILALLTGRLSADDVMIKPKYGRGVDNSENNDEGAVVRDERTTGSFRGVSLNAPFTVSWQQAEATSVAVIATAPVQAKVKVHVDSKGHLQIGTTGSLFTRQKIEVVIKSPSLDMVSVTGSGTLSAVDIKTDELIARVSGSGDLSLSGEVSTLNASCSGSGDLVARDIKADIVAVTVTGSGDAEVFAQTSIAAKVSGSGDLDIYGHPLLRNVSVQGSGSVSYR